MKQYTGSMLLFCCLILCPGLVSANTALDSVSNNIQHRLTEETVQFQAPDALINALSSNRIEDLRIMLGQEQEDYPRARASYPSEQKEPVPPLYLELNFNQDTVETEFGAVKPIVYPLVLTYGASGLYHEDYMMGSANIAYGSEITSNLTVDLGLKGLIGKVDDGSVDGKFASFGLYSSGVYDNRSSTGIPFEFSGMICIAPSVLNFMDADELLTLKFSLGIHVFVQKRGTIFAGYRYIKINFEDNGGKFSDSAPFVGVRFRF